MEGAKLAQYVMCWPTDLAVLGSTPMKVGIFLIAYKNPLHTAFNYQIEI